MSRTKAYVCVACGHVHYMLEAPEKCFECDKRGMLHDEELLPPNSLEEYRAQFQRPTARPPSPDDEWHPR